MLIRDENTSLQTSTDLEMWTAICNVHQCYTLVNKLAAPRDFYTATVQSSEKMLNCTNRLR
eukprot:IDg18135t1